FEQCSGVPNCSSQPSLETAGSRASLRFAHLKRHACKGLGIEPDHRTRAGMRVAQGAAAKGSRALRQERTQVPSAKEASFGEEGKQSGGGSASLASPTFRGKLRAASGGRPPILFPARQDGASASSGDPRWVLADPDFGIALLASAPS